jgi:hypothetical protein
VGPTGRVAAAANCRAHHARGERGGGWARGWAAQGSRPRGREGVMRTWMCFPLRYPLDYHLSCF